MIALQLKWLPSLTIVFFPFYTRNNHGDTALNLLRRRGVEKAAIALLEPYEEDEIISVNTKTQTLLHHTHLPSTVQNTDRETTMPSSGGGGPDTQTASSATHQDTQQSGVQQHSGGVKNLWLDFCADLGPERLVIVLVVIVCISLYVAYVVTGFAKMYDTRIPIRAGEGHTELWIMDKRCSCTSEYLRALVATHKAHNSIWQLND